MFLSIEFLLTKRKVLCSFMEVLLIRVCSLCQLFSRHVSRPFISKANVLQQLYSRFNARQRLHGILVADQESLVAEPRREISINLSEVTPAAPQRQPSWLWKSPSPSSAPAVPRLSKSGVSYSFTQSIIEVVVHLHYQSVILIVWKEQSFEERDLERSISRASSELLEPGLAR